MRQTCKVCGRPDKFDYSVPDTVWRAVVSVQYENRVVCLGCFDVFAKNRGVDYAGGLRTLYFAGNGAVFGFRVVTADTLHDRL